MKIFYTKILEVKKKQLIILYVMEAYKMAEEKKEEAQVEESKEEKKEKKGNWFSKTWGNIKKNVSDSNRESKLEEEYRKNAVDFKIYVEGEFGSSTKYGKLIDDSHAEIYGELKEDEIPYSSVLVIEPKDKDKELPKFFYVVATSHSENDNVTLKIKEKTDDKEEVENEYARPLTILTLENDIKEVHVIKVHGKYILKKEK